MVQGLGFGGLRFTLWRLVVGSSKVDRMGLSVLSIKVGFFRSSSLFRWAATTDTLFTSVLEEETLAQSSFSRCLPAE